LQVWNKTNHKNYAPQKKKRRKIKQYHSHAVSNFLRDRRVLTALSLKAKIIEKSEKTDEEPESVVLSHAIIDLYITS